MKYFPLLFLWLKTFANVSANIFFLRGTPWDEINPLLLPEILEEESHSDQKFPAQWMLQTLDHFNPQDSRVWKQRYFFNDQHFKEDGPVFLQLSGEIAANKLWLTHGPISTNYAMRYDALFILLEHRYYGESHPTEDVSTENFRYLTSEQALADIANFITYFKSKYPETNNSKWIVFGGSYAGALAAWMRMKYPHLVAGAIASSATVKAKINYKEYLSVVQKALGRKCSSAIKRATQQLSELFEQRYEWPRITKMFHLCDEFSADNKNDVSVFMNSLAVMFESTSEYNHNNRIFLKVPNSNLTLEKLCDIMTDKSIGPEVSRLAKVKKFMLDLNGNSCVNTKYNGLIEQMRQTSWSNNADGDRQWKYQTCVEFGMFTTSDLKNQPFGHYFPVEYFEQECTDIFGSDFNVNLLKKGVDFTNTHYGGFDMKVTNTLFVSGSLDPWHLLGFVNYTYANSKAILIEGTAHCADSYPESPNDPPQLTAARIVISEYIREILNNFQT